MSTQLTSSTEQIVDVPLALTLTCSKCHQSYDISLSLPPVRFSSAGTIVLTKLEGLHFYLEISSCVSCSEHPPQTHISGWLSVLEWAGRKGSTPYLPSHMELERQSLSKLLASSPERREELLKRYATYS